jgi:outer membrane protein assembly factor BamA
MQYKKIFYGNQIKTGTPKQASMEAARSFRLSPAWGLFLSAKAETRLVPAFLFTRSDLFYLGGFGSVRGYADETFLATRYFLGRTEPRFHLGPNDYLFGFFDFADLSLGRDISGLSVSDRFKPGVGLGISAGNERLVLVLGWGEKAKIKDGIVYLRLAGEL